MKSNLLLIFIICIGCGKTIVDPPYSTQTLLKNNLSDSVNVELYQNGKLKKQSKIAPLNVIEIENSTGSDSPKPPFLDTDSVKFIINQKYKVDINCLMIKTEQSIKCQQDSVSVFNEKRHQKTDSDRKMVYTYVIDEKDKLEIK